MSATEQKPDPNTNAGRLVMAKLEFQNMEKRMAKIATSFMELGAYEDAAKCAIQAHAFKWAASRIPQPTGATHE